MKVELVPLTFKHRDGDEVIKEAAMAYIPDLWSYLLDQNCDRSKRYVNINCRSDLHVVYMYMYIYI